MKRALVCVLCGAICFFAACGQKDAVNTDDASEGTQITEPTTVLPPQTITEAIAAGASFEAETEMVKNFGTKIVDGTTFNVAQGIATDGEYLYFTLRLPDDTGAVIVKTTLAGQEVACSERLDLGHANDLTYDSENRWLVVAHGSSSTYQESGNGNGRRLSFIDPDTLEVLHSRANIIPSSYAAGAIAYHDGKYYISRGGTAFRIVTISKGFPVVSGVSNLSRQPASVEGSDGYTSQGMGTDGKYVYFPMSGREDNIVVVYTLDGEYVMTFRIPVTLESESLVFVNGSMYVCFNANGAVILKVTFTLK